MKTIELDLEKEQSLDLLSSHLRNKRIKLGTDEFQLRIHSYGDVNTMLYGSFLLLLVLYFLKETDKKASIPKLDPDMRFYDKKTRSYYDLYLKTYDANKLENKIEKDFKIDIELEKKNPLNEVFGIWRNSNINIDKIRDKAWQRTK